MGLVNNIVNFVQVDGDDRLTVSLALLNEKMVDGAYYLSGEGLELAGFVEDYAPSIREGENLAELVAILVRSIWGDEALRALVSQPRVRWEVTAS